MIDYLERESGQADALEEQRRRLAAALTSAAAGERGGGADLSGVGETARTESDGGPWQAVKSERLPAEGAQTAEGTLPLLEETVRLERTLDSARGERAELFAARARGESRQAGKAGVFSWGQLEAGSGRNASAFLDGTLPGDGPNGGLFQRSGPGGGAGAGPKSGPDLSAGQPPV